MKTAVYISRGTRANWKRLKSDLSGKLMHGANKTKSEKYFLPDAYFSHRENTSFAEKILFLTKKYHLKREDVIYTGACMLLRQYGIFDKEHVKKVLSLFPAKEETILHKISFPANERDPLGLLYQYLLSEGEKNFSGIYYTPGRMVDRILEGCLLKKDEKFLDPCCGSGSFLLSNIFSSPENICGFDLDPVAVFIARINLLCKFSSHTFFPNIFCCDFLKKKAMNRKEALPVRSLLQTSFSLIATNPPWGGVSPHPEKKGKGEFPETFSAFFTHSFPLLAKNGQMKFLLPASVLKIKKHENLRKYILKNCCLEKIFLPDGDFFTNVMTKSVVIHVKNAPQNHGFFWEQEKGEKTERESIKLDSIYKQKNTHFSCINEEEEKLLAKIRKHKKYDLSSSTFALGLVTGDNKNKVKKECLPGMEKVYTGKEIFPGFLAPAKNFIFYDRKNLQQAAKEEYYRAKEKLVYRFISSKLVFACDDSGSLFLNSANILIPTLPGISIKTLMGLLNSSVLNFYYTLTFGDLKVLKKNLQELPLPFLTEEQDKKLSFLVEKSIEKDKTSHKQLQKEIAFLYGLDEKDLAYLEKREEKQ